MTTASLNGFNLSNILQTAVAQAVGQQKASYASQVSAALGSNPVLEVQVNGTVKYRTTISGNVPFSSVGLLLPAQLVEPPVMAVADTLLTNGVARADVEVVIRNATNSSIEIRVPVKLGGGTGFLSIDKGLTSSALRTNGLRLLTPANLDVSTGGGGTSAGAQVLVDDMGYNEANPAAALMYGDGWGTRKYGGYASNEYSGANAFAPWYEVVPVYNPSVMPYAAAPNTRFELRNLRTYAKINGVWQRVQLATVFDAANESLSQYWPAAWYHKMGYDIDTDPNTGQKYTVRTQNPGGSISGGFWHALNQFRTEPHWVNHGYPSHDFYFALNPGSGIPVTVMAEMRLALIDPNGTDDSGNVPLLAHVAGDWWHTNGYRVGSGHQGRFKRVTKSWQLFTGTNMSTDKSAVGGPSFPAAITAAQLLADPPPLSL